MNASPVSVDIVGFSECRRQIEAIRRAVFIVEQGIPESIEWDEHEHSSWHAIARIDNQPAGTGRLQTDGKLTRIAVLKDYRQHGIATNIIHKLLDTASDHQIHRLYLNAQTSAVSLYERFGFVAQGDTFDEGGIEHIRMVRQ